MFCATVESGTAVSVPPLRWIYPPEPQAGRDIPDIEGDNF
jgi:hypothetical protein